MTVALPFLSLLVSNEIPEDLWPVFVVSFSVSLEGMREGLKCPVDEVRLPIRLEDMDEVPVSNSTEGKFELISLPNCFIRFLLSLADHHQVQLLNFALIEAQFKLLATCRELMVRHNAISIRI